MYGMRSVLKSLIQNKTVADTMVSPDVSMRIFHLDCGRKYFTKEWIISLIKELSWLEMNELELDFSNGSGFRFALDDMMLDADDDGVEETDISMLPGGTTDPDGYLTQADMDEIIDTANAYGIAIVPNLDTPGHMGWILGKEQFRKYQGDFGLDVTNPKALQFIGAIVKKYAAYFLSRGCTTFHLGGDEYIHSAPSWMGNIDTSVFYDDVATYLDNLAGDLKIMGYKKTRLFNDSLYYNGFTSHEWKNIDEASYWSSGMYGFYFTQPSDLATQKGIRLINSNQSYYNILNRSDNWKLPVGAPETKKSPAGIYSQWKNDTFETLWSDPDNPVKADREYIDGSTYFMWCDKPDAGTEQEVAKSLYPRLRSISAKMVDDTLSGSYEEFAKTFTDSVGGFTADGSLQNVSMPEVAKIVKAYGKNETNNKIIDMIESLDSSMYTTDSWNAFSDALAKFKAVIADSTASSREKDLALNHLLTAFGSLEYGVQKLHLETALEAAESILALNNNYDETKALAKATENGKTVLDHADATQDDIDQAAQSILNELAKISKKSDIQSLESLIEAAKKLINGKYTSETLRRLKNAIDQAEAAVADQSRSDHAIEKAYVDLIDAITGLEQKGNKAALKAILLKAKEILKSADAYVDTSIEGLADAAAAAQIVYNNDDAVQSQINDAVKALTQKTANARLKGDVNNDGKVDSSDSTAVLAANAELTVLSDKDAAAADVNGDGTVDTNDAVLLLQYAAEKIASF